MTNNEHEIAETLYQFQSTIDHMKYQLPTGVKTREFGATRAHS